MWYTDKVKITPKPHIITASFEPNSGHIVAVAGLDKVIRILTSFIEKVDG